MFPLRDQNRSKTTPHVTRLLILVNIVMFIPLLYITLFPDGRMMAFTDSLYENFMMIPADILQGRSLHTLLTSMFLHADIFHIGGNMLFLYIFGDNVEDACGHWRYLLFYLFCGFVASLAHILSLTTHGELITPTLGASGAISGLLGAYIVLFPKARILTLVMAWFIYIVPIPAAVFLGVWFLLQLLETYLGMGGDVAYWAHIGGFIAGAFIAVFLRETHRFKERNRDL